MEKVCRSRPYVPSPGLIRFLFLFFFFLVATNSGCEMRMATATKKVSVEHLRSRHRQNNRDRHSLPQATTTTISTFSTSSFSVNDQYDVLKVLPRGGGSTPTSARSVSSRQSSSSSTNNNNNDDNNNNNNNNPFRTFLSIVHEARHHLAAAAVGRANAVLCCYPIETVKTRIQTSQSSPFRINGLYGGVGSCLFGLIPYTVLTFGSYEMYKKRLKERFPQVRPVVTYALSAILGDLTGSFWLCPPEVVKQQMQAGIHANTFEAVRSVWNQEGLRGFYRGYLGSVSRDVPFRVAQLTTFEVAKNFYLRRKQQKGQANTSKSNEENLTPAESAIVGGLAGVLSTVVTQPMDRIRTLLMTNGQLYGGSITACTKSVLKHDGVAGLYAGLLPRTLYIAPSVTIFFVAYEATLRLQRTKTTIVGR